MRFLAGLVVVIVGLTAMTVVWAMRKRDDALYVETDEEPASNVRPLRRAS